MMVYLIECGNVLVLYVKECQEYFIVDQHPEYLKQFVSGTLDCENWHGGKKFPFDNNTFIINTENLPKEKTLGKNISEEDLLQLFYLPENNPGAVIASRHVEQREPKIYNKYRFPRL